MRRLTRRQRVAAAVLAAVALCFITLDLGGSSLATAHGGVRGAMGALYRGTDSVFGPVRRFAQGVPQAATSENRIHDLEHQNAALRQQLADSRTDRATASRLKQLQLAATSGGYDVLPARVIALSPGAGFDWTVTLDAGSTSGVRAGQTVTDGYGLVGRVLHADSSSCLVLLAVDPGSGVGVRDVRSGQLGVATGNGSAGFTFVPMDPVARVRVGDQLVTGPLGSSSFVTGLAVGTVRTVQTSQDGTTRATVGPDTSPATLDLVGVIRYGGPSGSGRTPLTPQGSNLAGGR